MLNKKRAIISLGASILVFVIGMFFLVFTYKLLNSPAWMLNGMVWILAWPIQLLNRASCIAYPGAALTLSSGVAADVAILSGLIYVALSRFSTKPLPPSPPPPPLRFQ